METNIVEFIGDLDSGIADFFFITDEPDWARGIYTRLAPYADPDHEEITITPEGCVYVTDYRGLPLENLGHVENYTVELTKG